MILYTSLYHQSRDNTPALLSIGGIAKYLFSFSFFAMRKDLLLTYISSNEQCEFTNVFFYFLFNFLFFVAFRKKLQLIQQRNELDDSVIGVDLVSSLLTLKIFHTLF